MSSTTTVATRKICCACGADVSIGRRMRDRAGLYWCLECGIEDQRKRGATSSGASICSDCGRHTAPWDMVRCETRYICVTCSDQFQARRQAKRNGVAALADPAQRGRLALAVLTLAAGAALIVMFLTGMI